MSVISDTDCYFLKAGNLNNVGIDVLFLSLFLNHFSLHFFPSLNMIHISKDFLCLILVGMKNVYVIMCYSFFMNIILL